MSWNYSFQLNENGKLLYCRMPSSSQFRILPTLNFTSHFYGIVKYNFTSFFSFLWFCEDLRILWACLATSYIFFTSHPPSPSIRLQPGHLPNSIYPAFNCFWMQTVFFLQFHRQESSVWFLLFLLSSEKLSWFSVLERLKLSFGIFSDEKKSFQTVFLDLLSFAVQPFSCASNNLV